MSEASASSPETITPVSMVTSTPTIDWTMSESSAPFVDTNLDIRVNGDQKLMQWSDGKGSIDIAQGDIVNIRAFGGKNAGNPWNVAAKNYLIVRDNGNTICNKNTSDETQELDYSFAVEGGHSYTIFNYTLADN